MAHLFQEHEGYVVAERDGRDRDLLELHAGRRRIDGLVLHAVLPQAGRQVHAAGLPQSLVQINGAEEIMAYFREKLGIGHLETTADGLFSYEEVECLAACDRATCMQVNLEFVYD